MYLKIEKKGSIMTKDELDEKDHLFKKKNKYIN